MATRAKSNRVPRLDESCIYTCGPHEGYWGRAEYDRASRRFHGEVIGTRDVITFQGATIEDTGKAFVESVDDYLAYCRERGEKPERPFSGRFVVRISPHSHQRLSGLAESLGTSLNALVVKQIEQLVDSAQSRVDRPKKRRAN
jgi:predicted HicB family RNase H-like nuclease